MTKNVSDLCLPVILLVWTIIFIKKYTILLTVLYKDNAGSEVPLLEDNTSVDLGNGAGERGGEWPGGQNGGEVLGD